MFLVLSPFYQTLPPNIQSSLPPTPKNRPPYLGPLIFFSNKLIYVCSSALNNQFIWEEMHPHLNKGGAPTKKSAVLHGFWLFFGKIVWAPPFLRWGCVSFQRPCRSTQNYKREWDGGQILPPPQICSIFTKLRVECRSWCSYQTCPKSITWLSYGYLCHIKIMLSPKNHDYTLIWLIFE